MKRKSSTLVLYQSTRLNSFRIPYKILKLFSLILFLVIFVGCKKAANQTEEFPHSSMTKEHSGIEINPLKNAYFGETHVHTSSSMDAFIGGNMFKGRHVDKTKTFN